MSTTGKVSDSSHASSLGEGLRLRKIAGGLSRATGQTSKHTNCKTIPTSSRRAIIDGKNAKGLLNRQKRKSKWLIMFIFVVYVPLLAVFNPLTITKWYYMLKFYFFDKQTQRAIETKAENENADSTNCDTLTNVARVIFVRVPKTASTSIMKLFFQQQELIKEKESSSGAELIKTLSILDLGELEGDAVSSIPVDMKNVTQARYLQQKVQGFYDSSQHGTLYRRRQFYGRAAKTLLYPPPSSFQKPTLFQGHFHFINDWPSMSAMFYPNTTSSNIFHSLLPVWLKEAYSFNYPGKEEMSNIRQFTIMRNPLERYSSMYHYDRHATRTKMWRQQYVDTFGNATLNECLQEEECIIQNNIKKWCNLQTQVLCGIGKVCDDPSSPEAFEKAKTRITGSMEPSPLIMVGITERLEESLELLSRLLPAYLYFRRQDSCPVGNEKCITSIPRARVSKSKEELSLSSVQTLKNLCQNDLLLYDLANQFLSKQLETCNEGL